MPVPSYCSVPGCQKYLRYAAKRHGPVESEPEARGYGWRFRGELDDLTADNDIIQGANANHGDEVEAPEELLQERLKDGPVQMCDFLTSIQLGAPVSVSLWLCASGGTAPTMSHIDSVSLFNKCPCTRAYAIQFSHDIVDLDMQ